MCITRFEYLNIFSQLGLMQINGMSLWNYGVDVMDVLIELIVSLVCNFSRFTEVSYVNKFLVAFSDYLNSSYYRLQ